MGHARLGPRVKWREYLPTPHPPSPKTNRSLVVVDAPRMACPRRYFGLGVRVPTFSPLLVVRLLSSLGLIPSFSFAIFVIVAILIGNGGPRFNTETRPCSLGVSRSCSPLKIVAQRPRLGTPSGLENKDRLGAFRPSFTRGFSRQAAWF